MLIPLLYIAKQDSERDSLDHILNSFIFILCSSFSYFSLLLLPFPPFFLRDSVKSFESLALQWTDVTENKHLHFIGHNIMSKREQLTWPLNARLSLSLYIYMADAEYELFHYQTHAFKQYAKSCY